MRCTGMKLVSLVLFYASICIWTVAGEFRDFTNTDGQTIRARVVDYKEGGTTVTLERENRKKGRVPINTLSNADLAYLKQWPYIRGFLDENLLEIRIEEINEGRERRATDTREKNIIRYEIYLTNNNTFDFKDIIAEYCLYRDRSDYNHIEVDNYEIKMDSVPAAETFKTDSGISHLSVRQLAARFRFYLIADDETEFVREVCLPKPLPLDKYPWDFSRRAKAKLKANAPDPTSYPEKKMTEEDVRALVNQYISAFKNDDYAAWEKLLFPMHPWHEELDCDVFKSAVNRVSSIEIAEVDGLSVKLRIKYEYSRKKVEEWLYIHNSGYIKYTPIVFLHPVRIACSRLPDLVRDDSSSRSWGYSALESSNVPLFDYNPLGSTKEWDEAAEKIYEWLNNHGGKHDSTEPQVFISPEELRADLETLRRRLNISKNRH